MAIREYVKVWCEKHGVSSAEAIEELDELIEKDCSEAYDFGVKDGYDSGEKDGYDTGYNNAKYVAREWKR